MAKDRFTITQESSIKEEAQHVLAEMGISLSGGVELFLKAVIRERAIPFPITADRAKAGYFYALVPLPELSECKGVDKDENAEEDG